MSELKDHERHAPEALDPDLDPYASTPAEVLGLPESPMTKQIREEQESVHRRSGSSSIQSRRNDISPIKQFARPQSNGNDGANDYRFQKARMPAKPSATSLSRRSGLSFAPIGYNLHVDAAHKATRTSSGVPQPVESSNTEPLQSTESDVHWPPAQCANEPPTDTQSLPTALSAPQLLVRGSPKAKEIVNISSESLASPIDDSNNQEAGHGYGSDEEAAADDSGIALTNSHSATMDQTTNERPEVSADGDVHPNIDDGCLEKHHESATSSDTSTRSKSHDRKITKQPSPILSMQGERPVRVSKAKPRGADSSRVHRLPFVPAEQQPLSDENILLVLIHRRKLMEENLSSTHAKVKSLQARNDTLKQENRALDDELQELYHEHDQTIAKHDRLAQNLESFKAKYYKLKEYAKNLGAGMLELRQSNAQHKQNLAELTIINNERLAATENAENAIKEVDHQLAKQKQDLAAVRADGTRLFSDAESFNQQLADKFEQLGREQRRCRRLEIHISELSGIQQRMNKDILTHYDGFKVDLERIARSVSRVDTSLTTVDARVVGALAGGGRMLKAIHQELQEGPPLNPADGVLLASVQLQLKDVDEKLSKAVQKLGNDVHAASLNTVKTSLFGLNTAIETLKPSLEETNKLRLRNEELQGRAAASEKSSTQWQTTFNKMQETTQESLKAIAAASQRPQEQPQLQEKTPQEQRAAASDHSELIRKSTNLSSKLAGVTRELQEANEEKARLEQEVSGLQKKVQQQRNEHLQEHGTLAVQHSENLSAQRRTFETKIGKVQGRLDELNKVNQESDVQLRDLNAQSVQQKRTFVDLQTNHDKATREVRQLRSQITSLSKSLQDGQIQIKALEGKAAELERLRTRAQMDADEVWRLKSYETESARLVMECDELKKTLSKRDDEAVNLTTKVKKLEGDVYQLPVLQQEIKEHRAARHDMTKRLEEAKAVANTVHEMRELLESVQHEKSGMDAELQRLRPLENQVSVVTGEKKAVAQELRQVKDSLAQAQQQVSANVDLMAQMRIKEGRIAELEREAAEAARLRTSLESLQAETQQKDSLLTALQKRIESQEIEIQQAAEKAASQTVGPDLQPIPYELSQLPDAVAEELANSQDLPEGLPRHNEGGSYEIPPQRRVADRSARSQIQRTRTIPTNAEVEETLQLSQETSKIPDSLPNTQQAKDANASDEQDDSDSLLSEVDEGSEEWAAVDSQELIQSSTAAQKLRRLYLRLPRPPQQDVTIRPSSAAMSEDLFSKHASGVVQEHDLHTPAHAHSPPRQTVAPKDLMLDSIASPRLSQVDISPNRLRDGRVHGSTPQPLQRESTPDVQRSRIQPNSAMKQRMQDEARPNNKKQKRTVDSSYDSPSAPSSAARSRSSLSSAGPSRVHGSVIASPAPNLGSSQRRGRSGRKSSKSDKYSSRFA